MINIQAIQENIEKVLMIVSNNKCFCLDFNKLKEKLLIFFNNKTIEQIINSDKCNILNKPLNKIKKVCNLNKYIEENFENRQILKISIDNCQRVIGYFIKQQNIDCFCVLLYDPFHQYNIIESNKNLGAIALRHIYDFLQISNLSFNKFNKILEKHENDKK